MTDLLLEPYVALVLLGFLPSEIWRWLGMVLGRGLDEDSEIVLWVRAVATALVAGVVARIVLFPPGALAGVPLEVRLAAIACGFLGFYFIRRSPFAGVLVGEVVLIIGATAFGSR
ncbi:MAG TPA: AzlD domain-containing protein [Xanthobacteraceae bacterium]|nr:AzlD domain-containing protein [Xanthobacteraceae bacterium]